MRNIYSIWKREIYVYFTSPIAYVVLTTFLVLSGYIFYSSVAFFSNISLQASQMEYAGDINVTEIVLKPTFRNISVFMLMMMPIITMKLFAEEKKTGTLELILSYPIREVELLMGKFGAAFTIFLTMISLTGFYPALLYKYAAPDTGTVITGYIGLFLLGGAFIAMGLMFSSFTENQIVAAAGSFGALLIFWLLGWCETFVGSGWGSLLAHLSFLKHFDNFSKGIVDTRDIVYYLNLTILFLFITMRSLESKRWQR
jgi:ABC-2 type transport system permease protein